MTERSQAKPICCERRST